MNITLKKVRKNAAMEFEYAYSADVYVDGTKVMEWMQDGRGGEAYHRVINRDVYDALVAYANQQPAFQYDTFTIPCDVDILLEDLCNDYYAKRQIRKDAKAHVLYFLEGDSQGEYRLASIGRAAVAEMPAMRQAINMALRTKYGDKATIMEGDDVDAFYALIVNK